jgi:hypothetical protein
LICLEKENPVQLESRIKYKVTLAKKIKSQSNKNSKTVRYKTGSTRHSVKRTFASQFQKCLPHFSADIKSSGRKT